MHELGFRLKRAYLRVLELHKRLAAKYDLTPARFDVMVIMWLNDGESMQGQIREQLGLAPTTVSRMLRSMEQKGLVWRERTIHDRRCVNVGLTDWGLECIAEAVHEFVLGDSLRTRWDAIHREGRAFISRAIDVVRGISTGFRDPSSHGYVQEAVDVQTMAEAEKQNAAILHTIKRLESHGLAGLSNTVGVQAAEAARARKRHRQKLEAIDRSDTEATERAIACTLEAHHRRLAEQEDATTAATAATAANTSASATAANTSAGATAANTSAGATAANTSAGANEEGVAATREADRGRDDEVARRRSGPHGLEGVGAGGAPRGHDAEESEGAEDGE